MRATPRIYNSVLNDPLTWEVAPSQFFTFATHEDAKRAETFFNARERELAEAVELLKQFTKPTVSEFADYEPIGESPIITVGKLFDEARAFLQRMEKS